MKSIEIKIELNGIIESANIEYSRETPLLSITMKDGVKHTYKAEEWQDIFECFGLLRKDLKHIKFLCKGSKINVYPSGMSSQMSNGMVAYEVNLGKSATDENIVRIFDYEETDLTNDIQEQKKFRTTWSESLKENKNLLKK